MALSAPQSETELCNGALALLGVDERLSDVETDTGVTARRCRSAYPRARDALLTQYPWNFAARRASLPSLAEGPVWGYAAAYLLPADFLRLRHVRHADPDTAYEIESRDEGRVLLCDLSAPLDILYTGRITSVGLFDPLFMDALTARLAADLAMPVTQTRTIFETMAALAARRLDEAHVSDAREGAPNQTMPAGSWFTSRL